MKKLLTAQQFANRIGVSKSAVTIHLRSGKVPAKKNKQGHWLIDEAKAKKAWQENMSHISMKAKGSPMANETHIPARKKEADKKEADKKEPPALPDLNEPVAITTLAEAEKREKIAKAKLAEMKADEQAGTLVNANKVEHDAFEIGRKVRDSILAVPIRIAHELAAEHEPHKVEVLLQRELTQALEELTKRKVKEDGTT